jgi:hypothetical protein
LTTQVSVWFQAEFGFNQTEFRLSGCSVYWSLLKFRFGFKPNLFLTKPNLDCLVIRFIDCSNFGLVLNRIIRQTIIFHPEQRKPNLVSTEPNLDCLVIRFIDYSSFGLVSSRIWF